MIPVREFVELEKRARSAFAEKDYITVGIINQRLADINTSLYRIGNDVYLTTFNPQDVILPEGENDER